LEVFEGLPARLRIEDAEGGHEAGVIAPIVAREGGAAPDDTQSDLRTPLA
jgi:hypothetical protein